MAQKPTEQARNPVEKRATRPKAAVPTTFQQYRWLIGPIVALIGIVGVNRGWWTAEQFAVVPPMLMEKREAETPTPIHLEPQKDDQAAKAEVTPQQWADLIRQILDEFNRSRPEPNPEPPKPEPPKPTPTPEPHQINITDEAGKKLAATTVEAGRLYLVTASSQMPVAWAVSRFGDVGVITLPENAGYVFDLSPGSFVEFHLTDSALKTVSTKIECKEAGPKPEPPKPEPNPEPMPEPKPDPGPKPTDRHLALIVFADVAERTPEVSILLRSRYWQAVSLRHRVSVYDRQTNETAGKAFLSEVTRKGDVLLIRDDDVNAKLAEMPLPRTEADFEASIRAWSTR